MEKLYNIKQLAEELHLNKQTIQRFIRMGKIKAIKIGREYRVTEQSLQEYFKLSTFKVDGQV